MQDRIIFQPHKMLICLKYVVTHQWDFRTTKNIIRSFWFCQDMINAIKTNTIATASYSELSSYRFQLRIPYGYEHFEIMYILIISIRFLNVFETIFGG